MTRDYYIDQAFKGYILENFSSPSKDFIEKIKNTFYAGVTAADKYPTVTWTDVDIDLPCWHKEFLITSRMTTNILVVVKDKRDNYHFVSTGAMVKSDNWDWNINCDDYEVVYWMPKYKT